MKAKVYVVYNAFSTINPTSLIVGRRLVAEVAVLAGNSRGAMASGCEESKGDLGTKPQKLIHDHALFALRKRPF